MLTILIPAYNEEDAIVGTIAHLRQVLEANGITGAEILVIDDGSKDQTGRRAADAGARVLTNPHNIGYGRSLKRGVQAASHDTICMTDADLTYPAEAIPALLQEYRRGNDMVVGARQGMTQHDSLLKSPLRRALRALVEYAAGRQVPDANSGMRVFSRAGLLPHLPYLCDRFSFTTSMTIAYMLTGRFVTYLPIEYRKRVGSSHVRLLRDIPRTILYISLSTMYYRPLKIFLLVCALCVALAAISLSIGAIFTIKAGYYLGLAALVMVLMVFVMGLVADVLRQILLREGDVPR